MASPNYDFGSFFNDLLSKGSSVRNYPCGSTPPCGETNTYSEEEKVVVDEYDENLIEKSKYDELKAEFDQYRKNIQSRIETEKKFLKRELLAGFLSEFVVFLVNTYKGKKNVSGKMDEEDFLILKKMNDYLDKMGIVPMEDPMGKPFDTATMDAVYSDTASGLPKGTVSKVFSNGFTLDGEVLLHQKVSVSG